MSKPKKKAPKKSGKKAGKKSGSRKAAAKSKSCPSGHRAVVVKSGGRRHTVCAISGKTGLAKILADKADHGVSSSQVGHVLNALSEVAKSEVKQGRPFQIPGVVILRVDHKKARKARTIPNPFKPGEKMKVKAKKAHNVVKARIVKAIKTAVGKH